MRDAPDDDTRRHSRYRVHPYLLTHIVTAYADEERAQIEERGRARRHPEPAFAVEQPHRNRCQRYEQQVRKHQLRQVDGEFNLAVKAVMLAGIQRLFKILASQHIDDGGGEGDAEYRNAEQDECCQIKDAVREVPRRRLSLFAFGCEEGGNKRLAQDTFAEQIAEEIRDAEGEVKRIRACPRRKIERYRNFAGEPENPRTHHGDADNARRTGNVLVYR